MRQIEKTMCAAIARGRDMRCGNTAVVNNAEGTAVYLHGHLIWQRDAKGAERFSLCGWNTPTTRSRLRALGVDVRQREYCAIYNGKVIDSRGRYVVER